MIIFLLCAILVAAVFITFAPSVGNDFVDWDDLAFVVKNRNIHSISWDSMYWMLTTGHQGAWHPLTWFSHALDIRLFGLKPSPHHLMNVIFHILNTLLVFGLTLKLLSVRQKAKTPQVHIEEPEKLMAAFVTALLFALHPLRVESVAWVSERKDVLFVAFYLMGLIAYLSWASEDKKGSWGGYAWTLVFFVLSIMSKSMAITFPFALLILDYYPLYRDKKTSLYSLALEKIPLFVISALGFIIYQIAQSAPSAVPVSYVPVHMRVMNAFHSIVMYIRQSILPGDLIPLYQMNRDLDYFSGIFIVSAIIVIVVTGLCIWRALKSDRIWISVWAFYLVTLFPAMGLYMAFRHSMADRYTYLPTLGLWILVGIGVMLIWRMGAKYSRPYLVRAALVLCVFILAIGYAARTRDQIGVWKNTKTLWTHVLHKSEIKPAVAYYALGRAFHREDKLDKALALFKTATSLNPKNPVYIANMAAVYLEMKEYEKGLELYKQASNMKPTAPVFHAHLGRTYALMERYDEAEKSLLRALELDETFHSAHMLLTLVYLEQGDRKRAAHHYKLYAQMGLPLEEELISQLGVKSVIDALEIGRRGR
jgi:tetratricopeptide (TPR) repeat protein